MTESAAIDHRYMLGELIGAGGMGRVYAAADGRGSSLAVKLLNTALAADPIMVTRLVEEARITRRVSHRNVIRVVDDGITADGAPFLVMDRVNGTPLRLLIQNEGPLALSRVREIAAQMLAGLAAIHRAGLVHGDIKSANVLVERTGGADRVTIIDFGLARSLGPAPLAAGDYPIAGTPDYMAPELVRGEPASIASDLYAVGVVLYEMVTGTTPFGGGTVTEIFERQLAEAPVPPSSRCDDRALPAALEHVIMRALEKTAEHRHDDAPRLAAELARSLPDGSDDRAASSWRPAASFTDAPTHDWSWPDADAISEPHRRLAEGTLAQESAPVRHQRDELRDAVASNQRDPIVVAYLGLARALIDDRRLRAAAAELEAGLAWLSWSAPDHEPSWRIELTLAAIYDGLGDPDRAWNAAQDAYDHAGRIDCELGQRRATMLLRRFAAAGYRNRRRAVDLPRHR